MRSIYLRLPDGKPELETGAVIVRAHLEAKGHKIVRNKTKNYDAVLCWGCGNRDPLVKAVPALNGKVNSFNKLGALQQFKKNRVLTPVTIRGEEVKDCNNFHFYAFGPWFGRNISHAKGKDIQVFPTWEAVEKNNVKDFYTLYVAHQRELRAWTFQGKTLAVYEKHYKNPGLENYKNLECRSELRDDLLQDKKLISSATKATEAINLDFGAVDMLQGNDGNYYVLEVNSMPDISSMIRVSGIRLADQISKWVEAL